MPVSANHPYEAYIWEYVYGKLGNAIGAAAMMGNFWAESSLYPNRLQSSKVGDGTSEAYTAKVDSGQISRGDFINNGPGGGGYGLAQWTYYTRKANMYDKWKNGGYSSIGDIDLALDFWWWELNNGYGGTRKALINATDIKSASNYVLFNYERPADQGTSAQTKRANRAQIYYDYYSDGTYEPPEETDSPSTEATGAGYYFCTAPDGEYVNIRSGPGTSYSVVDILHKGDVVYVVTITDGWAEITSPVYGYVMASWLQTAPNTSGYFYCKAPEGEYVNIRSGPGTSYSVVDILHRGDVVYAESVTDGWAKITSPVDGYVMASWLQYEPIGGGYFPAPKYNDFIIKYLTLYKGRRYRVVR